MAIPKEILAIKRPSSTVVKQHGNRFVVIKRTSKRVGNRVMPVDLGTVGEIVGDKFIERVKPQTKKVDIKDYGEVMLCDHYGTDLLKELASVWDIGDAKRLYVIALLRAAYGDVKNRDLQLHYETSFASELYPGVHLSEQSVSAFLQEIGQAYSLVCKFMRNRVAKFAGKNIVIDGMLKDYNSKGGSLSEFSRKGAKKGSKDISLLYAFNPETREPIAAKPYAGNMLDQTTINNFVTEYNIQKGLIRNYEMDNPTGHLLGYEDATILYKKVEMTNIFIRLGIRRWPLNRRWATCERSRRKTSLTEKNILKRNRCLALSCSSRKQTWNPC